MYRLQTNMTIEEIRALLNDIESDRVERTISTTNTDKFGQAICAFANDLPDHRIPGYLFLGVKDDGTVTGLDVTDELLKNAWLQDNLGVSEATIKRAISDLKELGYINKEHSKIKGETIDNFNRLPDEFTVEDVMQCFAIGKENIARVKISRLIKDNFVEKIG